MPWLPMYIDNDDLKMIIDWLNQEECIAFIVNDGIGVEKTKWKAVKSINDYSHNRYCLWHVPSGPLPLLTEEINFTKTIVNPFEGWEEERTGADDSQPYFGAGHIGIFWLDNSTKTIEKEKAIGLSCFEWIGNHYRILGYGAPEATEKWWQKLKRWVKKQATLIPREENMKPEIWCFPGAMDKIQKGMQRDVNP